MASLIWSQLIFIFLLVSCRTDSKAKPYVSLTTREAATDALNRRDFEQASLLWETLIAENPGDYELYPYLATAYAGRAGFDIVSLMVDRLEELESDRSLNDSLSSFLPSSTDGEALVFIRKARDTLLAMPEDFRNPTQPSHSYAASAALQLNIYASVYALLYMNQFVVKTASGTLDPEQLAKMSEEDAVAVIQALSQAAGSDGVLKTAVQSVLDAITSEPGDNLKDKLSQYLAKQ